MLPYLVQLLDITINNEAIPGDWKKTIVIPIYEGRDRSVVANYRPVSLTSVVCEQMEHVKAGYLRIGVSGYTRANIVLVRDTHAKVK